jgi:hypothetical protein
MEKQIIDLGYVNDWGGFDNGPELYKKCREDIEKGNKHEIESRTLGRCYHKTICHTCGISWSIDSSD